MDFLSSNSMAMLEKSMNFLWTKQAALSDNISNEETPNYKPKVVTFEESLRNKLNQAAAGPNAKQNVRQILDQSEFAVIEPQESVRMDDNGVNVTEQMVEVMRNSYQLQYVYNSINSNLNILRMAVRGQ